VVSAATACALAVAAGCRGTLRMYPGAKLPKERTASLSIPREVRCEAIDRRKLGTDNPRRIELMAGTHTIRIQYFGKKLRTGSTQLSFNLEPGHDYELRYRMYRAGGNRIYSPGYLKLLLSSPKKERRTLMPETVFGANRWCPFVFDVTARRRVTLRDPQKDRELTAVLTILARQDRAVARMEALRAKTAKKRKK
jgi:hypothetical protein